MCIRDSFYGTGIPTCILVVKKCREHHEDILFIDASKECDKVGNKNELRPKNIDKIVNAYRTRKSEEKFSYVAPMDEIAIENEFNLNIPRYVDTFEPLPAVNLREVAEELGEIHKSILANDELILDFCRQLKIAPPIGAKVEK